MTFELSKKIKGKILKQTKSGVSGNCLLLYLQKNLISNQIIQQFFSFVLQSERQTDSVIRMPDIRYIRKLYVSEVRNETVQLPVRLAA